MVSIENFRLQWWFILMCWHCSTSNLANGTNSIIPQLLSLFNCLSILRLLNQGGIELNATIVLPICCITYYYYLLKLWHNNCWQICVQHSKPYSALGHTSYLPTTLASYSCLWSLKNNASTFWWSVQARYNWAALRNELFQTRYKIGHSHMRHLHTCLAKISSFVFTQQTKILL